MRRLDTLKILNGYFEKPLYLVGGAVRDMLMGLPMGDLDIASANSPDEIFSMLSGTEFTVKTGAKKLFTLIIKGYGEEFEHTSFRVDSYTAGNHRPDSVTLTSDMEKDALRRDFTANAVYYDVEKDEYIDLVGGISDIRNKVLRTVIDPFTVLSQDGLRLMRLVRFACELGFSVEEKTLDGAKRFASLLTDIAKERVREELDKILLADGYCGIADAPIRGLELMREIGLTDIVLPFLLPCVGLQQKKKYHLYDVYNHTLMAVRYADRSIRLAALLHDVGKPVSYEKSGGKNMHGHDVEGAKIADDFMSLYRYSTAEREETVKLVALHMFDLGCDAKEVTVRRFLQENHEIIDKLLLLKEADFLASGVEKPPAPGVERLRATFLAMKEEGIPMTVKELKADGTDLISLGIPERERSKSLSALLSNTVYGGEWLTREKQLSFLAGLR